ncbi:MAG TPA: muconolactone Delta-isomerase family protein [Trebonia sp.]|jgi:muconolactone delta-isomerase|nr:muconolactone Delta-isomerase family protein [Trebonia sp.]
MLYFFKARVVHEQLTADELWDAWEADATRDELGSGLIKSIYKVVGQQRVIGVFDLESHGEMDRLLMEGLTMSHVLEWEELTPVREYSDFADDVKHRRKRAGKPV